MCGLVTIFGVEGIQKTSESLFNQIEHRGPDQTITYYLGEDRKWGHKYSENSTAMVGFHRLAIRGFQDKYGQPYFIDGSTILLFNGELYNCAELLSKLKGNVDDTSDTFILAQGIKQHGIDFIKYIKGMFSIVVIDLTKNSVFYCRDKFGIKPLYFLEIGGGLLLASEKHLLFELGKANRPKNKLFNKTPVVSSVPKGVLFCFEATHKNTQTTELTPNLIYNRCMPGVEFDQAETKENFKENFESSLRRMSVFDGAGALLLSSGIDSNALYICSKNLKLDLQCYTFDYKEKNALSEYHLIEKYLERGKVKPIEMDNALILRNFLEFCDENNSVEDEFSIGIQKEIYRAMAKDGIRVAFSGQGADEVWLGYEANINNFVSDLTNDNQTDLALEYLKAFKCYDDRNWHRELQRNLNLKNQKSFRIITLVRRYLRSKKMLGKFNKLNEQAASRIENRLETLLRWEDLNSMRYSIETRLPYLDYDFFSYAMKFKPFDLFSLTGTKAPLRDYINSQDKNYSSIPSKKLGYTVQKENIAKIYFEDSYNLKLMKELNLKNWDALSVSKVNAYKNDFAQAL